MLAKKNVIGRYYPDSTVLPLVKLFNHPVSSAKLAMLNGTLRERIHR